MRMLNDSNTNWLGNIPAEWSIGRIGQLYSERRVKVSDTEYMPLSVTMKGVVPQLSTAAKTDAHDDRKLVRKGDFAINSRSDRRGSCGISEYDGSVSLINTILAPRKSMSPRYYNWLFHTSEFAAEFYKWGHGIVDDLWTTNWNDMKRILVPVPSLLEQERIADFLDRKCAEIDKVLVKTKTSIEEYKKLKQSVITKAVTKGIRGEKPMKDSGSAWFGKIPASWDANKLKYTFTIRKRIVGEDGNTVLAITQKGVKPKDMSNGNGQFAESYANYQIVHPGDFAMNHMDLLTGWVDISKYEGVTSPDYRVFTLDDTTRNCPGYYLYMMQMCYSNRIFYSMGQGVSGMGRWRLPADMFNNFIIACPPFEEQQEIAEYLDKKCSEIDSLIASKEKFITELESYKKSLIYEYVTGKKEVPSNA